MLLVTSSPPFSWRGAEFCCNFSVLSFLGSRSRPHLENFRQSVCCLFEYGRKPMHARVKWSDQVRCLILSLVLLLFHPFGVSRTVSTADVHVRLAGFLLNNKCCCRLSGCCVKAGWLQPSPNTRTGHTWVPAHLGGAEAARCSGKPPKQRLLGEA